MRLGVEELIEAPGTGAVNFSAMAKEGPMFHRNDRCLVRPLFRELSPSVNDIVQKASVVRSKSREKNEIMGRDENVHIIDLDEAQPPNRSADMCRGDPPRRARAVESLSRQGYSPGFLNRDLVYALQEMLSASLPKCNP